MNIHFEYKIQNIFFLLYLTFSIQKGQISNGNLLNVSPKCSDTIHDVVFILDASQSISDNDFRTAKEFLKQMIQFLKASNTKNRIAFVVFGDSADIVFDFNKYDSINEMLNDVDKTNNQNGLTAIGKALNLTLVELFPTMRTDKIDKMIILLTDGTNNKYPEPYTFADKLKTSGVRILTIGVESDINKEELKSLATAGLSIIFDKFSEISNSLNQIIYHICPIKGLIAKERNSSENSQNVSSECSNTIHDVVFLLDVSNSISEQNYTIAKFVLLHLIQFLKTLNMENRIASIEFKKSAKLAFNFNKYNSFNGTLNEFKDTFNFYYAMTPEYSYNPNQRNSAIDKILNLTSVELFPQMRTDINKTIILLTELEDRSPESVLFANKLKSSGVRIMTIGVGLDVNKKKLKALATPGLSLTFDKFSDLYYFRNQIYSHICPITVPSLESSCGKGKLDLVFLLNTCHWIPENTFEKSKEIIIRILEKLDMRPDYTRVAIISFANDFRIELNFGDFDGLSNLKMKLKDIKRSSSGVINIGLALEAFKSKFKGQLRSGVPSNIILLITGNNSNEPRPEKVGKSLRAEGVNIATVGIGKNIFFPLQEHINSEGKFLYFDSYDEAGKKLKRILKTLVCNYGANETQA